MKFERVLIAAAALLVLAAPAAAAEKLKVVASFSIVGDFARHVGGDRIELQTLVGPNGDAHVYEPRPADAALLARADVVLVNGLNFEGFLERLVAASGTRAAVAQVTRGVDALPAGDDHHHEDAGHDSHADGHDHGALDPHAFQSAANAEIYVGNIADAFCAADAAGCDTYRVNAAAYSAQLKALDAELKADVARIPADKRVVITSHDAFRYFEHAYGIEFLAPEGVSTESEASAADVARLIDQVREDKASALFMENVTNPRLIEQIAAETGIKVGGALYSDALSAEDGPAATYVDMMRHNMRTIAGAINGS